MRPLAPSEKRRGLVLLATSKRLCGYYESGAANGEPKHAGGHLEPAKHWFFMFGRFCVLFYDPLVAVMTLFFVAFAVMLFILSDQPVQRVLAGIFVPIVVWRYARVIDEQFYIKKLIKGDAEDETT